MRYTADLVATHVALGNVRYKSRVNSQRISATSGSSVKINGYLLISVIIISVILLSHIFCPILLKVNVHIYFNYEFLTKFRICLIDSFLEYSNYIFLISLISLTQRNVDAFFACFKSRCRLHFHAMYVNKRTGDRQRDKCTEIVSLKSAK